MNKRDKRVFIKILKYCGEIAETHKIFNEDKAVYDDDVKGIPYRNSIAMDILQIGELANHLTDEMLKAHKDIPWSEIVGMRNIAAHHYDEWDYERAWNTSQQDVPELAKKIQEILDTDKDAQ